MSKAEYEYGEPWQATILYWCLSDAQIERILRCVNYCAGELVPDEVGGLRKLREELRVLGEIFAPAKPAQGEE